MSYFYNEKTQDIEGWRIFRVIFGGLFLLWLLGSIIEIIPAGEVGVVTQFGKVTGREMAPGFNVKAPWPLQGVEVFDTRVQKEQADASAASSDLQEVKSTVALNYHLDSSKVTAIYQNVGDQFKERLIDPAIQEAFKATTAQYNAADLITKRPEVKDKARVTLESRLHPYGIMVDDLSIVNFDFSDDFNKAIEAKQVAQQEAERAQYKLDAARKDAQAQEAQKTSLSPELLQKYAIDKWDGKMPQYVGSGSIFNIPLTK